MNNYTLFFKIIKEHPKHAIVLFILILSSAIIGVFGIGLILPILELITNSSETKYSNYFNFLLQSFEKEDHLLVLLGLFGFMILLKNVLILLREGYKYYFVFLYRQKWQNSIFSKYINSSLGSIYKQKHGVLLNSIIIEPTNAGRAILGFIDFLAKLSVSISFYLMLLFANSTITISLTLMIAIVFMIGNKLSSRYSINVGKKRVKLDQEVSSIVSESLSGLKQIKMYTMEQKVLGKFKNKLYSFAKMFTVFNVNRHLPLVVIETIAVLSLIILLYFAVYYFSLDLNQYIPVIGLFVVTINRLIPNLSQLYSQKMLILSNFKALEMMNQLMLEDAKNERGCGHKEVPKKIKDISFENVCFSYTSDSNLFDGINLNFSKGQVTGLIGSSGSGKTTVADLICGFLKPDQGKVLFDEINTQEFQLKSLRNNIGYIDQNSFLFNASLRENLLMGRHFDEEQLNMAINKASLDDFIKTLPAGLETKIDDGGENLSGGQKQRISIARSLLGNPPIIIFDEATSALDIETEKKVRETINDLKNDHIVILVTHRIETAEVVDYFYVLDNGRISQEGARDILDSLKSKMIEKVKAN